ncbi:hypothetical protein BDY24DRAFT_416476 [Mrakia frigida]|uniref:uncharacterized protein n=1 Tax=Mrakia frigida TaxID=29902 RepID=UPI003FCBEF0C
MALDLLDVEKEGDAHTHPRGETTKQESMALRVDPPRRVPTSSLQLAHLAVNIEIGLVVSTQDPFGGGVPPSRISHHLGKFTPSLPSLQRETITTDVAHLLRLLSSFSTSAYSSLAGAASARQLLSSSSSPTFPQVEGLAVRIGDGCCGSSL